MRGLKTLGCFLAVSLFLTTATPAALISGFPQSQPFPKPDVYSALISFGYVASTNKFTASGSTQSINTNSGSTSVSGTFSLVAYVDSSGNPISGDADTLTITGPSSTTLFHSGTGQSVTPLSAFGFVFNSTQSTNVYNAFFDMEYVEDSTAGTSAAPGAIVGLTLSDTVTLSTAPSFGANFSGTAFDAVSDAFPLPEPTSGMLLAAAGGLLWRRRRLRNEI